MELNIEIGKTYNYFDDGKIRESRRMPVTITDIVPFNEIDSETLELWKEEVVEIDWVYNPITDYFVKGTIKEEGLDDINVIFVRTLENDWFSLGWWAGRLDVDGSLTALLPK